MRPRDIAGDAPGPRRDASRAGRAGRAPDRGVRRPKWSAVARVAPPDAQPTSSGSRPSSSRNGICTRRPSTSTSTAPSRIAENAAGQAEPRHHDLGPSSSVAAWRPAGSGSGTTGEGGTVKPGNLSTESIASRAAGSAIPRSRTDCSWSAAVRLAPQIGKLGFGFRLGVAPDFPVLLFGVA